MSTIGQLVHLMTRPRILSLSKGTVRMQLAWLIWQRHSSVSLCATARTVINQHHRSSRADPPCQAQGLDFYASITRARFEELNMDLFRRCMEPVEKVLRVRPSRMCTFLLIVCIRT